MLLISAGFSSILIGVVRDSSPSLQATIVFPLYTYKFASSNNDHLIIIIVSLNYELIIHTVKIAPSSIILYLRSSLARHDHLQRLSYLVRPGSVCKE
jgi:hypothetical protein